MSLAFPLALLLLPLPWLVRYVLAARAPAMASLAVDATAFAAAAPSGLRHDPVAALLRAGAWIALVVALAGPRVATPVSLPTASGREIILALDLSGSMAKTDFVLDGRPLSRLDAVKAVAARFIAGRQGDRIGLVVFGDRAYVAQPPTFDVASTARAVDTLQIGISGLSTAISEGLGLAVRRLSRSDAKSKAVILLSDGIDTSGKVQASDAAQLAARHGIRVHTIALGPEDLESQPDASDAVDVAGLRATAAAGGGASFRVRTLDDLVDVAATLDRLEPNPMRRPPALYWRSLWMWPAAAALVLAALLALLPATGRRS
ncbi:VWA domain-containing protein [Xanthobacter aminoxidans]|uniref:VWA domain-containing protein n=1 Tax=Xanthobacter aminoxidans TaxID=186280 RepID=UPI002022E3D6|nr:VWA domain-containing protein [Xanthobacter aminoxidans]MCL8384578.1 VWA domain-containing protein [Xanthobacter aminoxidans]